MGRVWSRQANPGGGELPAMTLKYGNEVLGVIYLRLMRKGASGRAIQGSMPSSIQNLNFWISAGPQGVSHGIDLSVSNL